MAQANNETVTTLNSVDSVESWTPPDRDLVEITAAAPLSVPYGSRDAITNKLIRQGMQMADFSGERGRGRYYTRKTYKSLNVPKRNPFNRRPIGGVLYYVASITPRVPRPKGGSTRNQRRRRGLSTRRNHRRHL